MARPLPAPSAHPARVPRPGSNIVPPAAPTICGRIANTTLPAAFAKIARTARSIAGLTLRATRAATEAAPVPLGRRGMLHHQLRSVALSILVDPIRAKHPAWLADPEDRGAGFRG